MDRVKSSFGARVSSFLLKARRVFFKMSLREKALAMLFAFALLLIWFSWQLDRHTVVKSKSAVAARTEELQELQIGEEENVRSSYERQKSAIDLTKLPTKDEASGQIDALARRFGFANFDLRPGSTIEGADLRFHTFNLSITKELFSKVRSFTQAVQTELPFVSLEDTLIQAQPRDDDYVDVRYVFKSIEYKK